MSGWHKIFIEDKNGTRYGMGDANDDAIEFTIATLAGFIAKLKEKPSIHPGLDPDSCRIYHFEFEGITQQAEEITPEDIELLKELGIE